MKCWGRGTKEDCLQSTNLVTIWKISILADDKLAKNGFRIKINMVNFFKIKGGLKCMGVRDIISQS